MKATAKGGDRSQGQTPRANGTSGDTFNYRRRELYQEMSTTEKATEMHTMLIADPRVGNRTIEWNGQPEERAIAKSEFKAAMATNLFLAYATVKAPAKGKEGSKEMIRDFDPERETTWLVPRLVGG